MFKCQKMMYWKCFICANCLSSDALWAKIQSTSIHPFRHLTLARVRLFTASNLWGGVRWTPSRSAPDGPRDSRKNKRVARNERKPMASNFMVLG